MHHSQRPSETTGQSGEQSFDTDAGWRSLAAILTSSVIESALHLSYHLAASCFHGDLLDAAATDLVVKLGGEQAIHDLIHERCTQMRSAGFPRRARVLGDAPTPKGASTGAP